MGEFTLTRNTIALVRLDLESGVTEALGTSSVKEGETTLCEMDVCSFVVHPVDRDIEYRVLIGDVPASQLMGENDDRISQIFEDRRIWGEHTYFESARGMTEIGVLGLKDDQQVFAFSMQVYVIPTKISEVAYQAMSDDVAGISQSLLADLFGKSTRSQDFKFGREIERVRSPQEEMDGIFAVLAQLGQLLRDISRSPAHVLRRERLPCTYWGDSSPSGDLVRSLATQGVDVRSAQRPLRVTSTKLCVCYDIPSHRGIRWFLNILARRAALCERAITDHIRSIEEDRSFRDIRFTDQPSLYQSIDLPRIERLRGAQSRARSALQETHLLSQLDFLSDIGSDVADVTERSFSVSDTYARVLLCMRGFLLKHAVLHEGSEFVTVAKLTHRLFEQWCFFQLVEAFRAGGLDLSDWSDQLNRVSGTRYILDFDRGLAFEGRLSEDLMIRIRYEPWIFSENTARRREDSLCRMSPEDVSWSPDIVIECLARSAGNWEPNYVVVADCKYTTRIRDSHWTDTMKYFQIRSVDSGQQVVKQLWLIALGGRSEIVSEDPGVQFGHRGASGSATEHMRFRMLAKVGDNTGDSNVFVDFARGTLDYFLSLDGRNSRPV